MYTATARRTCLSACNSTVESTPPLKPIHRVDSAVLSKKGRSGAEDSRAALTLSTIVHGNGVRPEVVAQFGE